MLENQEESIEQLESIQSMRKKIVIIGSGGHGVTSLSELLNQCEYDFYVYYNTGDWGGSWGLWGRLLEFNNNELNRLLHGMALDVLPFADLNKAICHFINSIEKLSNTGEDQNDPGTKSYFEKVNSSKPDYKTTMNKKSLLDFRSTILSEHKIKIKSLIELVKFDAKQQVDFQNYFDVAWNFYQKNKLKLKYDQSFCLGYVLQTYIFHKSCIESTENVGNANFDPMFLWNKFWQDLDILPKNVYLDFTSKNRQVMTAQDLSLSKLSGEDQIDGYHSPILPKTMIFENIDESISKPKKPFIKMLNQADLVIIPNGSVGNWLTIINYQKVQNILQNKPIIWLTNPYRNKNELINPNYILYFKECGISVNTFVPIKNGHSPDCLNVLEQDKNGRYIPSQVATEILKVFNKIIF